MIKEKFVTFFKKYGYYCIAGVLVLAIGLTIVLATRTSAPINVNPDDITDVDTKPISWAMPMNDLAVLKSFSDSELQYNKTLNVWEAHKSVDLTSSDLSVFAVAAGTVTAVEKNNAFGTVVTITHKDGFVSTYASLDANVPVKNGDTVEKGQKIGEASNTAENESEDGNHLHFEMYQNGSKIDPSNYLNFENK